MSIRRVDPDQSLDRLPLHYAAYLARRAWCGRYTGYRAPGAVT